MKCLLFVVLLVVACLSSGSSGPCVGSATSAGSGDQYEPPGFAEALEAVLLLVDGLRGLVTAL